MKFRFKYLWIILFLVLATTLTSNGQSTWYIKNQLAAGKTIDSGSDYCNVYIKNITTQTIRTFTQETQTIGGASGTGDLSGSTDSTNYNKYYGIIGKTTGSVTGIAGTKFKEGDPVTKIENSEKNTMTGASGETITTWTETNYTFTILLSNKPVFTTYYGVRGTITTTNYTETTARTVSNDIFKTYSVRKNTCLARPTLTRDDGNFTFVNYLQADATGINTNNEEFDFSTPITTNTILFAEWIEYRESEGEVESKLTNYINSVAASATSNIYYGTAADFNILDDNSYSAYTNTVNLGTKTLQTTIAANATINFCMNNGDTDYEAREGEKITDSTNHIATKIDPIDNYVSLDYTASGANVCDYTIILQNDLIINGNLYLGGYTGSQSTSFQGYIIKNYVKLDLNGHDIIIQNGGMLHSFGYIMDSIGTGKITVKAGGNLKTQLVLDDLKGGNHTVWVYSKGLSPFENYRIPYLKCKAEFEVTDSNCGSLDLFTKFSLGSLGFTNIYIAFFSGNDDSFMKLTPQNTGSTGKVILNTYELANLKTLSNVVHYNCVDLKNKFVFQEVYVQINSTKASCYIYFVANVIGSISITIDQSMDIELDRLAFPISSAFDLNFIHSTFSFFQKLKFMPGSNLYMDENSTLNLDYYKVSGTAAKRTFNDITISKSVVSKTLPGESLYLSAGISSLDQPPFGTGKVNTQNVPFSTYGSLAASYYDYWNYFQSATINIYGNVNFNSGNEEAYCLAGNININKFSIDGGTSNKFDYSNLLSLANSIPLQTYGYDLEATGSVWFESASDALDSSNDPAITRANYFYARPLVSNGIAYVIKSGSSKNMMGDFDFATKIFTNRQTNESYFFNVGTSLLDSSDTTHTKSSQDKRIDYSIEPTRCTLDDANHWITDDNGNLYILYAGIMVPLTITTAEDGTKTYTANTCKLATIAAFSSSGVERYQFATTPFTYHTSYKVWRVTY